MLNIKEISAYNSLCLNCVREDCPGICDELKENIGVINNKRKRLEWNGVTHTVPEWSEILGISKTVIYDRINKGLSVDEILRVGSRDVKSSYSRNRIELVYTRISTMHIDYLLYWDNGRRISDSAGMTTNYNKIVSSPTNKINSIVEARAMPDIMESDFAQERKAWIACILFMIYKYRSETSTTRYPTNPIKANILEWRAIDGWTMKKIGEYINEHYYKPVTIMALRKYMQLIVDDIIPEADRRGLFVEPQK